MHHSDDASCEIPTIANEKDYRLLMIYYLTSTELKTQSTVYEQANLKSD